MNRKLIALLIGIISTYGYAQTTQPKLVVGIVVDQMRNDYLQRFESKFSEGGFKRLLADGFQSRNTQYNYIPTNTAPGHASIYTGTTPKYHGIISNDWYSKILDATMYCVEDSTALAVGGSESSGKISPVNLQATTITDQLKLATNFKSKVIGVSIKDRGAVLPAGHVPDGSYWYDSETGNFMTSDYYMETLPAWVNAFNNKKLVDKYSNQTWSTLLPIEQYVESTPDNTIYERGFDGKDTPTFPYDLKKLRKENGEYGLIRTTPFGNTLVLDLAKSALEGESLGADDIPDFLAVSLSSTDYVGHNFAPNSIEIEDTYLRLDQNLAEFLKFLDDKVGEGNYVLFLTADHGVVENPSFLVDNNLPGGFVNSRKEFQNIMKSVTEKLGEGKWINRISGNQIFLNLELIEEKGLVKRDVEQIIADIIDASSYIFEVMTASDLNSNDYSDPLKRNMQNGFNRKLSGDILFTHKAGYLSGRYGDAGTSHGSGFTYDTHVPLLFYGTGIKKGSTVREVMITDITPTLAMLLNISLPNAAVSGAPIIEIFE